MDKSVGMICRPLPFLNVELLNLSHTPRQSPMKGSTLKWERGALKGALKVLYVALKKFKHHF